MATLTEQLDALIAEHGLASLTLCRIVSRDGSCFWSVDVQAELPTGVRAIGTNANKGDNPSDALTTAIDALNAKRFVAASVPELEAA